ncbi:MAG: transcriptional regulator [Proteobacteria bacterium]|nr:transcriptional regulator [Pseudomonadota bacterium]
MSKHLVLTLIGPDQVGIVEKITEKVLKHKGNVEESKMARLGGEFAMLLLISVPEQEFEKINTSLDDLKNEGFHFFIKETRPKETDKYGGWLPYRIDVSGADHEGIINSITHHLSETGINVETLDTNTSAAPMSGTLLFTMTAIVIVPPHITYNSWLDPLDAIANEMHVNIDVSPYTGK